MKAPIPQFVYNAVVGGHVDGDTIRLVVDQGFNSLQRLEVRLFGIDTPERGQPGYQAAKEKVAELIPLGSTVVVQTFKPAVYSSGEKWGRWLATVWLDDGRLLNRVLVDEGLARPYDGGAKARTAQGTSSGTSSGPAPIP